MYLTELALPGHHNQNTLTCHDWVKVLEAIMKAEQLHHHHKMRLHNSVRIVVSLLTKERSL